MSCLRLCLAWCLAGLVMASEGYAPLHEPPPGVLGVTGIDWMQRWQTRGGEAPAIGLRAQPRLDAKLSQIPVDTLNYLEVESESAGLIVYRRQGRWLQLRTWNGRAVWLDQFVAGSVLPLADVIQGEHLHYFTAAWDGKLRQAPGLYVAAQRMTRELTPLILEHRWLADVLWFKVRLQASICAQGDTPVADIGREGWVPFSDAAGRYTIWKHTRGC